MSILVDEPRGYGYVPDERERSAAEADLIQLKAVKLLLSNNDLAAEIHIAGMKVGVCMNKRLIPVINNEIKEIENYLARKDNNYI